MGFSLNFRSLRAALLCALLGLTMPALKAAAEDGPSSGVMFFHGTVTEVTGKHLIVSRTLVGHAPEKHKLLTNKKTKFNRILHVKAKVTVKYERRSEGDIALDIHVHPPPAHLQFSN